MAARLAARDPRRLLRQPVRQPGQPAWHTSARPRRRRSGSRWRHRLDAVVCGVGSGGTLDRADALFRPRQRRAIEMVLADPAGSVLADLRRQPARSAKRARGWSRASARISSRRSPTCRGCSRPTRFPTRRAFTHRAASCCSARGSSAARPPARCSPRRCATAARSSAPKRVVSFVSRHRQQVPFQDVQRFLDGRPGLPRACRATATCAT